MCQCGKERIFFFDVGSYSKCQILRVKVSTTSFFFKNQLTGVSHSPLALSSLQVSLPPQDALSDSDFTLGIYLYKRNSWCLRVVSQERQLPETSGNVKYEYLAISFGVDNLPD